MDRPTARFDIETGTLTIEGITPAQARNFEESVIAYGRALAASRAKMMHDANAEKYRKRIRR